MNPTNDSRSPRALVLGALALFAATPLLSGCSATLAARPPVVYAEADVVVVEHAPPRIETYPRAYYAGAEVYLVEGHWYRHDHGRWVVYRSEPVELGRRRAVIERRMPVPSREHGPGHGHGRKDHRKRG